MIDLGALQRAAQEELETVRTNEGLESWRIKHLGRSAALMLFLRELAGMPLEQRKEWGSKGNAVRKELQELCEQRVHEILVASTTQSIDITQPGMRPNIGSLHPITRVKNDLNDAFKLLGFEVYDGPEISSEGYDFDALNFPPDHPARESMDTYWIKTKNSQSQGAKKLDLRPHLTGLSVRYMQTHTPPFRFVYPGRAFRSESTDAGHEQTFYQYEALVVDEDISLSGGKVLVYTILERVFGKQVTIRMRPGFFPFVEPGFEIDMQCLQCGGKKCSVCGDGWVEMMPGGPPHPNVLRAGGIDPAKWQGFYINIGLDRLAMMKYGINDIRLMHSGDLRFLRQF